MKFIIFDKLRYDLDFYRAVNTLEKSISDKIMHRYRTSHLKENKSNGGRLNQCVVPLKMISVRDQFPLVNLLDAAEQCYLDSAATSQKPQFVIDSIVDFYNQHNFPLERSIYPGATQAAEMIEAVKALIKGFLDVGSDHEVIFCKSATEAANLVAKNWMAHTLASEKNIGLTPFEHNSNLFPWIEIAGAERIVEIDPARWSDKDLSSIAFLSLTMDSNVYGPLWQANFKDLKALIERAKATAALVALDAAQAVSHKKISVKFLDPDFLWFSGHKVCGPTGIGVLVVRGSLLQEFTPMCAVPQLPSQEVAKFSCGSIDAAQIIALGAAISWFNQNINFDRSQRYLSGMCKILIDFLSGYDHIKIIGNQEETKSQGHQVSFFSETIPSHDIADTLGQMGVFVRSGTMCAEQTMKNLKINNCVRASFYHYTSIDDLHKLIESLKTCFEFFERKFN